MRIIELQIKNFGKFRDKRLSFEEGINIIYGENEMGKSTIHSFIKGMFFGIEKQRGRIAKNDEYSLRQPWDNPNYFAGALRFENGGKIFRLERNFEKREKSVYFLCETDGEELSVADGDLQVLLEGLNGSAFQNTIFIPQKSSETEDGLAIEVQRFMGNMENAGDSDIDINAAIKYLMNQKKQLESIKKERLEKVAVKQREVQIKYDYNEQEIIASRENIQESKVQLQHMQDVKERVEDELAKLKDKEVQTTIEQSKELPRGIFKERAFLLASGGAISLGGGIFLPILWLKVAMIVVGLLFIGLFFWWRGRKKDVAMPLSNENTREAVLCQQLEQITTEIQKQNWNIEYAKTEWKEKLTIQGNLQEDLEEIAKQSNEKEQINTEIEAILLAVSEIKTVSEEFYKRTEKALNQRVSTILGEITGGRYTNVFIDVDLQVKINTPEKLLAIHQVSRGTMEQIYFALRMAVAEMLCKGEVMPIILDETFAMYDEVRLTQTLRWLYKSKKQVILFTCHKREAEILAKIKGVAY